VAAAPPPARASGAAPVCLNVEILQFVARRRRSNKNLVAAALRRNRSGEVQLEVRPELDSLFLWVGRPSEGARIGETEDGGERYADVFKVGAGLLERVDRPAVLSAALERSLEEAARGNDAVRMPGSFVFGQPGSTAGGPPARVMAEVEVSVELWDEDSPLCLKLSKIRDLSAGAVSRAPSEASAGSRKLRL